MPLRVEKNAQAPFYVEDGCCTLCGLPAVIAPDLVGEVENDQCFVKRQPISPRDVSRMLKVILGARLRRCVRSADRSVSVTA